LLCDFHFVRLAAMKPWLTILAVLFLFHPAFGTSSSSKGKTLTELKVIPARVLQRSISPKFYKSLLISPVEGWITVRAQLSGSRLSGMRVVKSDLNGNFDSLALKLAGEVRLSGGFSADRPNTTPSVLLHLLIYQIADGTMALSFAHFDEPGGDQMAYYGCARLAVLKSNGKWVDIKGPESLEGKGLAVKQGPNNNSDAMRFEMKPGGAEATNMGNSR
jgi:hypothetical protein